MDPTAPSVHRRRMPAQRATGGSTSWSSRSKTAVEEDLVMLDLGLSGKVAIITGGSDGLGRAAAEKLSAEGAKVAICARRKEHLEKAADEIKKATGGQVLAHVADVSRAADCERLVDAVVA